MSSFSVVITTLDEEANIVRAIRGARLLSNEILVVDSGSRDATVELARNEGVRILSRDFDDMARQRNAALAEGRLQGEFVLFQDADEVVTEPFAAALRRLVDEQPQLDGIRICRRFHLWGRWIRAASSYPHFIDRVVRRGRTTFRKAGHGEVFEGGERFAELNEPLHDEDLKPIGCWIERHNRYAALEARELAAAESPGPPGATGWRRLRARLRRIPGWPAVAFTYYLLLRGGILEGRAGTTYCGMKAMYEYLVQLHLRDLERRR